MKNAIITGASKGIGLAITKSLIDNGYLVYGIARDFSATKYSSDSFIKMNCDLTKTSQIVQCIEQIKTEANTIDILVNNAGVGFFSPHEQLNIQHIEKMVATNLQAPLILTNLLLRKLKSAEGYIINISSITAKKSSTHGCAYAATKAGLSHFSISLFDEVRKSGVKVVTIHPDMTDTGFFNNTDFTISDDPFCHISPEDVAQCVTNILKQPEGTIISDIVIRPQKHGVKKK
jgi:Short-chain dehydrogenases of various substrate specificities